MFLTVLVTILMHPRLQVNGNFDHIGGRSTCLTVTIDVLCPSSCDVDRLVLHYCAKIAGRGGNARQSSLYAFCQASSSALT